MSSPRLSPELAAQHGLSTNTNNGHYHNGFSYSIEKKLQVASVYKRMFDAKGSRPVINEVARECSVSKHYVRKVEKELINHEGNIPVVSCTKKERGSQKKLDAVDNVVLFLLYLEEPSRSNQSHKDHLEALTGKSVSTSTVSRFFNHSFEIKGSLRKPNLIPCDKFKPINIQRAIECLNIVAQMNPARLKFTDEKLLKGEEIHNRKTRRNTLTGEIPVVHTESDFRNTHSVTGICSIDMSHPAALWFQLHDERNDATSFSMCVEGAIKSGFLKRGDILVMDNAAYHTKGDNQGTEDWLWTQCGILALMLPTRSPELNPIELVWRMLVQQLKTFPLTVLR